MSLTWKQVWPALWSVTLLVPPVHSDHCPVCAGFSSKDWCQASAHSVQSVLVPHLMPVIEPLRLNRCRPAHQTTQLPWMASQPMVAAGAVIVPAWCPSSDWCQASCSECSSSTMVPEPRNCFQTVSSITNLLRYIQFLRLPHPAPWLQPPGSHHLVLLLHLSLDWTSAVSCWLPQPHSGDTVQPGQPHPSTAVSTFQPGTVLTKNQSFQSDYVSVDDVPETSHWCYSFDHKFQYWQTSQFVQHVITTSCTTSHPHLW